MQKEFTQLPIRCMFGSRPARLRLVGISVHTDLPGHHGNHPTETRPPNILANQGMSEHLEPMGLERCCSLLHVNQSDWECGGVPG